MSKLFNKKNSNLGKKLMPSNLIEKNEIKEPELDKKNKQFVINNSIVEVFFANNEFLKNQYYELRQNCFTEVDEEYRAKFPENCLDWQDYDGSETEDDRRGKILVAVEGCRVVAGARFLLSTSIPFTGNEEPWNNFTIKKFLEAKGYNSDAKYCEIEDIVIDKSFRNRLLIKNMFRIMIDEAINSSCDYMFGVAIHSACRNDKLLFASLGYKVDIHFDYPWIKQKNHGYEERYPIITKL